MGKLLNCLNNMLSQLEFVDMSSGDRQAGGCCDVSFGTVGGQAFFGGNQVAVVENKPIEAIDQSAALELLQNGGIVPPFIQPVLYRSKCKIITSKATCDLSQHLKALRDQLLPLDIIKDLFAQLLLVVNELHRNNLVHRDIKPNNVLVHKNEESKRFLTMIDFDGLAKVDETGKFSKSHIKTICGATTYIAPEVICIINAKESVKKYNDLNLKAVDCYALGFTFAEIIIPNFFNTIYADAYLGYDTVDPLISERRRIFTWIKIFSEVHLKYKKCLDLVTSLLCNDPQKRCTIEKAMFHDFFGSNKKIRERFFEQIWKCYYFDRSIDDYYMANLPEKDDIFYLLPSEIKVLYMAITALDNKLDFAIDHPDQKKKAKTSIENSISAVKEMISNLQLGASGKLEQYSNILRGLSELIDTIDLGDPSIFKREPTLTEVATLNRTLIVAV